MNKYIVLGAIVAAGLAITGTAFAANYAKQFVRAELFAVEAIPNKGEVLRFVDGKTTCYVFGASISCVK